MRPERLLRPYAVCSSVTAYTVHSRMKKPTARISTLYVPMLQPYGRKLLPCMIHRGNLHHGNVQDMDLQYLSRIDQSDGRASGESLKNFLAERVVESGHVWRGRASVPPCPAERRSRSSNPWIEWRRRPLPSIWVRRAGHQPYLHSRLPPC